MGRSVTDHTDEGIHNTELQQADRSRIVLMKGSIRQRYSGQIVQVLTHKTGVSFQESPETEVSFQMSIVMDLQESARQRWVFLCPQDRSQC